MVDKKTSQGEGPRAGTREAVGQGVQWERNAFRGPVRGQPLLLSPASLTHDSSAGRPQHVPSPGGHPGGPEPPAGLQSLVGMRAALEPRVPSARDPTASVGSASVEAPFFSEGIHCPPDRGGTGRALTEGSSMMGQAGSMLGKGLHHHHQHGSVPTLRISHPAIQGGW